MLKNILNLWAKARTKDNLATILSQGINVIISILAGKLISVYVLPSVFGEYNLEFGIIALISSLFITPAMQYYKVKVAELRVVNLETFTFFRRYSLYIAVAAGIVLYFFSFFAIGKLGIVTMLLAGIYLFFNTNVSLDTDFLNVKGRLKMLAKINILKQIFYIIALSIALFIFRFKSSHLWLVLVFSLIITNIFSRRSVLSLLKINRDKINNNEIKLKEVFKYSAPLLVMSFAAWVNSFSDRYVISYFLDETRVGQYNASYGLGSKVFLMINPVFLIVLTPIIYNLIGNQEEEAKVNSIIKNSLLVYTLIGLPVLILMYLFSNWIGYFLLSENYSEGFIIIPWISTGYFFLTITYLINLKFYAFGRTKWVLFVTLISAIINLIINVIVIPKVGIIGGGLSTAISFLAGFIISLYLLNKKIIK